MRHDMDRVLIERPRAHHHDKRPRKYQRSANLSYEDLPSFSSMKKNQDGRPHQSKYLSDLLGPLRRFLASRVGQRWDDVFSEICQNLDRSNASQAHVFNHIFDFVETHVWVGEDGKLWCARKHRYFGKPMRVRDTLYVCPLTGILRRTKDYGASLRKLYPGFYGKPAGDPGVIERNGKEYRQLSGIWYEAIWADVLPPYLIYPWDDPNVPRYANHIGVDIFTGKEVKYPGRYRAGKRQLNTKELRKLGATNEWHLSQSVSPARGMG